MYAPYDNAHYEYLGQPDGTPAIGGVGPGQDEDPGIGEGGGDIDIASSCETNLLNVSSLNLLSTDNNYSADQGHTFTTTTPSSANYIGVDRQWFDNDGPLTIYQSVHDTAAANAIVVMRSTDGGLTWLPTTGQVINPAQPDAFAAALPLNNKLGNIVVDQHRHYLYQVYSAGATATDNVNGYALHAVWMAVSLDQGATWTDHLIYADPSTSMRTDNVFPVVAVDDAGNVYATWSLADTTDAGTTRAPSSVTRRTSAAAGVRRSRSTAHHRASRSSRGWMPRATAASTSSTTGRPPRRTTRARSGTSSWPSHSTPMRQHQRS